jgi:hypothetical protein
MVNIILAIVATLTILAQTFLGLSPEALVIILMPIITWLATGFFNWLKAQLSKSENGFGGLVLTGVLVPALSAIVAWIMEEAANPDLGFWTLFSINLGATWLNEILKQAAQSFKGAQTKASKELIG